MSFIIDVTNSLTVWTSFCIKQTNRSETMGFKNNITDETTTKQNGLQRKMSEAN